MLRRWSIGLLFWLAGAAVAWAGVRTTPDGLRIESGDSGYTLAYPEFMEAKGKSSFKPIEVKASGARAVGLSGRRRGRGHRERSRRDRTAPAETARHMETS